MNEFTARWDEIEARGFAAGRFRVDAHHPLDLFLSFSEDGRREIRVFVNAAISASVILPEFEHIQIIRESVNRGACVLLRLSNGAMADQFSVICTDLVEASASAKGAHPAFMIFMERLMLWADVLRKRRSTRMRFEDRLGLMGELRVLDWMMREAELSPAPVISGWRGADGDSTDISINGLRIESKAQLATRAPTIKVSSLDQLDPAGGRLAIVHQRLTPSTDGESLESLIKGIQSRFLVAREDLLRFQRKLLLSGYDETASYASEAFELAQRRVFEVGEDFPVLTRHVVPQGIVAVRYDIACSFIGGFERGEDWLRERING